MYPLLLEELVKNNAWVTQKELIDMFAIAQMTPGPVATNAATFVGYKMAGIPGAVVATVGVTLPSMIVMLILVGLLVSFAHSVALRSVLSGLRPVVVALIVGAAVIIGREAVSGVFEVVVLAASLFATWRFKANPLVIILVAGGMGMLIS